MKGLEDVQKMYRKKQNVHVISQTDGSEDGGLAGEEGEKR